MTQHPYPEQAGVDPWSDEFTERVRSRGAELRAAMTATERDRQDYFVKMAGTRIVSTARRSAPRRRGTGGRPAGRAATRSSARSGDSGPGEPEPEPEPAGPAALEEARRVLARAARRLLAETAS